MPDISATYDPTIAKCQKCGNNGFELAALRLLNTKFSPWIIQCKTCGSMIGVVSAKELAEHAEKSKLFDK
jgi:predicted nucleic-acid-binding Zn-ribbon protein